MDTRTHPSDGTLPRHTFPPIFLPNKKASTLQLKARNIYQKTINAGKWQNFAAGIGTGATYSTLHGLRWHPDWLTIIEYVRQAQLFAELPVTLHYFVPKDHLIFHKCNHILR